MSNRPVDLAAVREGREALARLTAERPELTSPEAQARLTLQIHTGALTVWTDRRTIDDMAAAERHTVNIRLDPALVEALEGAAEVAPTFSRHAICRVALHIGLDAITKDRTLMLDPIGAQRPAKKRKRTK